MRLSEILPDLTARFEPHQHQKRKLPGGGEWWFIPWQTLRDRLNEVCPEDWTERMSDLTFINGYCTYTCTLTICGVSHQGVGTTPIEILNSQGKDTSYGDPIERAIADAFKNACKQFGIGTYLDEQRDKDNTKKQAFLKWVAGRGDTPNAARPRPVNDHRAPVMRTIDDYLMALNKDRAQAAGLLKDWYGVTSRQKLTDEQLIEFSDRLLHLVNQNKLRELEAAG